MAGNPVGNGVFAAEFFAAKGSPTGVFLAVPRDCGLKWAKVLRVDGLEVSAISDVGDSLVFPEINQFVRERLLALSSMKKPLAVGEFSALGAYDSYFLEILVIK